MPDVIGRFRTSPFAVPVYALVLTLAVMLHEGYRYGVSDQVIEIPIGQQILNFGAYHQNDLVANIATEAFSFAWPLVALILTLNTAVYLWVIFVLYIALKVSVLIGVYKLAGSFITDVRARYLAMMLLAFDHSLPGGSFYIGNFLNGQLMALPLVVFAIHFTFRRNHKIAFLLLGIAANIHGMSAVLALLILTVVTGWLILEKTRGWRAARTLVIPMGLALIGSSPTIIWIMISGLNSDAFLAPGDWLEIVRQRDPYIFPTVWGASVSRLYIGLLIFAVILPVWISRREAIRLWVWMGAGGILAVGALVTIELIPLTKAIALQPFRGLIQLVLIAGIALSIFAVNRWSAERSVIRRGLLILIVGSFAVSSSTFVALGLFIAYLALWWLDPVIRRIGTYLPNFVEGYKRGARKSVTVILGLTILVLIYAFVDTQVIDGSGETIRVIRWARLFTQPVFYLLLPAFVFIYSWRQMAERDANGLLFQAKLVSSSSAIGMVAAVAIVGFTGFERLDLHPLELKPNSGIFSDESVKDGLDLQIWARETTPVGTLFLTSIADFRVVSRRSSYVENKIGAFSSFSVDYGNEWYRRQSLVTPELYENIGELNQLAILEDVSYVVFLVEGVPETMSQAVYTNPTYAVYELPLATASN